MTTKALLLGGLLGLAAGLIAGSALAVPPLLESGGASFVAANGDANIDDARLRARQTYILELDECSDAACTEASPWYAATVAADASADLSAAVPTVPRETTWVRWRAFATNGTLVAQSAPAAWTPAPHIPMVEAILVVLLATATGTGVSLLAPLVGDGALARPTSAPTLARGPALEAAPVARPAPAPAAPVIATVGGTKAKSLLTVCDAASKLPLTKVKVVNRKTGAVIQATPSQDAGRFLVEHAPDEEAEIRVPGYDTLSLRLTGRPLLAEMPPRRRTFRIRVVGGTSGSPLPGVPVRLVRGGETLAEGATRTDGEFSVDVAELRDDDLAETAVGVVGFIESKARVWQAAADGVVELPLTYEFRASAKQEQAASGTARDLDGLLTAWTRAQPDLAGVLRFVGDTLRAPLGATDEWGRFLLGARVAPSAWWDALVEAQKEFADLVRALLDEATRGRWLGSIPPEAEPLIVNVRFEPDWGAWMQRAPDSKELERVRAEVDGIRLRAAALSAVGARNLFVRWADALSMATWRPEAGAKGAAARLRIEAQIAVMRWYLGRSSQAPRTR